MKSGPHLPQLEKALAQKRRPNTAKKFKKKINNKSFHHKKKKKKQCSMNNLTHGCMCRYICRIHFQILDCWIKSYASIITINIDRLSSIGVCTILHFYWKDVRVSKQGFSEWIPTVNKIVMSYDILYTSQEKKNINKNKLHVLETEWYSNAAKNKVSNFTLCLTSVFIFFNSIVVAQIFWYRMFL